MTEHSISNKYYFLEIIKISRTQNFVLKKSKIYRIIKSFWENQGWATKNKRMII